ncbi:MAG: hypothetical protein HFH56_14210 [Lachnospiraceae bacterium]|nr:hypothetical protein [Lachnospiraceae bacterium]MCI9472317.1 hypothetical protein [Lachnospiraceae bacterium]
MNISKLIRSLGIRSTLKGYRYLKYGLELCMRDEDYLLAVYKELYPDIAEYFGTTQDGVEHCIRTAVCSCWYKGNRSLLYKIAGYELLQKPTNSEFIDILYHYLNTQE